MKSGPVLVLMLLFALPILGACAASSGADGPPAPGTDLRDVQFVGDDVLNPEGHWIGEVAAALSNPVTGELDHLVISYCEPRVYGRALSVTNPERFVPIPWARFTPVAGNDTLLLDADEMTLVPAPYLDEAPDSLSAAQAATVDEYWQSSRSGGN